MKKEGRYHPALSVIGYLKVFFTSAVEEVSITLIC